jgi:hypothetical protein
MTSETSEQPVRWKVLALIRVLCWVTGMIFAVILVGTLITLMTASDFGAQIGNTEKREGVWAFCLLIGCVVWWITWMIFRFCGPFREPINRLEKRTAGLAPVALGFLWMCFFPPLYYFGMDYIFPPTLGTKAGFVRIMSTGELLQAGTILPTTRFERSSKVVPLSDRTTNLQFDGLGRDGFTTRITATVKYRVRSGESFRELLIRRYADVPFLSNGYDTADRVQYPFLDDEVAKVLHPVIEETLTDLAARPVNGAPSELTIRSRSAAERSLPSLPPWLEYVRVSNLSVESWKKDQ